MPFKKNLRRRKRREDNCCMPGCQSYGWPIKIFKVPSGECARYGLDTADWAAEFHKDSRIYIDMIATLRRGSKLGKVYICWLHFKKSDMKTAVNGRMFLKFGALPTKRLFPKCCYATRAAAGGHQCGKKKCLSQRYRHRYIIAQRKNAQWESALHNI